MLNLTLQVLLNIDATASQNITPQMVGVSLFFNGHMDGQPCFGANQILPH